MKTFGFNKFNGTFSSTVCAYAMSFVGTLVNVLVFVYGGIILRLDDLISRVVIIISNNNNRQISRAV